MRRALLLLCLFATPLIARVDRVDIISRADLGPHYEKITGRVYYALDPRNPHNAVIVDLDKAARNAAGDSALSSCTTTMLGS